MLDRAYFKKHTRFGNCLHFKTEIFKQFVLCIKVLMFLMVYIISKIPEDIMYDDLSDQLAILGTKMVCRLIIEH